MNVVAHRPVRRTPGAGPKAKGCAGGRLSSPRQRLSKRRGACATTCAFTRRSPINERSKLTVYVNGSEQRRRRLRRCRSGALLSPTPSLPRRPAYQDDRTRVQAPTGCSQPLGRESLSCVFPRVAGFTLDIDEDSFDSDEGRWSVA